MTRLLCFIMLLLRANMALAFCSTRSVCSTSFHDLTQGRRLTAMSLGRRELLAAAAAAAVTAPGTAAAADRATFESVGAQTPALDPNTVPFTTLTSGVKVKDLAAGGGGDAARAGSKVYAQVTGRLLNLNGVKFYSTRDEAGGAARDELMGPEPVILSLGDGTTVPGLEEGIIGMRKGGIRRIVVPPDLGYGPTGADSALRPSPTSAVERNALDSVAKNARRDATLLFDVKVERVK